MNNLYILLSPLDQFEVIDLFSLNANLLGNIHLSLTNIGLYLLIGAFLILTYSLLASNENKIIPNNWSISQESIYATMHSTVVSQINPNKGQIYFPFIYSLFIFILVNNLIGMVKRCLFVIINSLYVCTYLVTFFNQKIRSYSSNSKGNYTNNINPHYFTGFSDGEGCFNISIYKDNRMLTGWQVKPIFLYTIKIEDC